MERERVLLERAPRLRRETIERAWRSRIGSHGFAHTEYRAQGSTRYAELHLVDQHVNQRSLA